MSKRVFLAVLVSNSIDSDFAWRVAEKLKRRLGLPSAKVFKDIPEAFRDAHNVVLLARSQEELATFSESAGNKPLVSVLLDQFKDSHATCSGAIVFDQQDFDGGIGAVIRALPLLSEIFADVPETDSETKIILDSIQRDLLSHLRHHKYLRRYRRIGIFIDFTACFCYLIINSWGNNLQIITEIAISLTPWFSIALIIINISDLFIGNYLQKKIFIKCLENIHHIKSTDKARYVDMIFNTESYNSGFSSWSFRIVKNLIEIAKLGDLQVNTKNLAVCKKYGEMLIIVCEQLDREKSLFHEIVSTILIVNILFIINFFSVLNLTLGILIFFSAFAALDSWWRRAIFEKQVNSVFSSVPPHAVEDFQKIMGLFDMGTFDGKTIIELEKKFFKIKEVS